MDYSNRTFARSFLYMLGGNAMGQAIWILSSPALTRLYDPASFGIWMFFMSSLLICAPLSTLRMELAIVTATDQEEAARATAAGFWIVFGWLSVTLIGALAVGGWLIELLGLGIAPIVFLVVPLAFALVGPQLLLVNWAIRQRRFSAMAWNAFLQAAAINAAAILAGIVLESSPANLVGASIAAYAASNVVLAIALRADVPWSLIRRVGARDVRLSLRSNYRFPLYSTPYGLVGLLGSRGLDIVAGLGLGAAAAGLVGLAMRVSYLPIAMMTRPLNQLYFAWLTARRNDPELARSVYLIEVILVLIAAPLATLVALKSTAIAATVFGPDWSAIGPYIAWLMPPTFCLLLTSWLDRTYDVVGRQRLALSMEGAFNVILITTVIATVASWADPLAIVIPFAILTTLYNLIWLSVTLRQAGFGARIFPRLLGWICLAAGSVWLVDWLTGWLPAIWNLSSLGAVIVSIMSIAAFRLRGFVRQMPAGT
jgi:O-antigen/teichoic acid export membrane protein